MIFCLIYLIAFIFTFFDSYYLFKLNGSECFVNILKANFTDFFIFNCYYFLIINLKAFPMSNTLITFICLLLLLYY